MATSTVAVWPGAISDQIGAMEVICQLISGFHCLAHPVNILALLFNVHTVAKVNVQLQEPEASIYRLDSVEQKDFPFAQTRMNGIAL